MIFSKKKQKDEEEIRSKRSSEMKKITKFQNKLKQNDNNKIRDSLLGELDTLNLSRFAGEIAGNIADSII